jgi:hypothetical protein
VGNLPIECVPTVFVGREGRCANNRIGGTCAIKLLTDHQEANRIIERHATLHDEGQRDEVRPRVRITIHLLKASLARAII